MFHFLFVPLPWGCPGILVIAESAYADDRQGDPQDIYPLLGRSCLASTAVMGVTTGITLEFQFGTNWASLLPPTSATFSAPRWRWRADGLLPIESTPGGPLLLRLGQALPGPAPAGDRAGGARFQPLALWILIAKRLDAEPVDAEFNPMTMRMELTDVAAVIFNLVAQVEVRAHGGGRLCGCLPVRDGVSSWYLLRRMEMKLRPAILAIASGFGPPPSSRSSCSGTGRAIRTGEVQKVKLAAIEAECSTEPAPASLHPVRPAGSARRDHPRRGQDPYLMGIIATRSLDGAGDGPRDLKAQHEKRIPVACWRTTPWKPALRRYDAEVGDAERHRADLGLWPAAIPAKVAGGRGQPSPRLSMTPFPGGAAVLELPAG